MPRRRSFLFLDQDLGEWKLQHHLAVLVGDDQRRRQELGVVALILQDVDDHGSGDLPGVVRIAKLLALGVGNGVVANPGVEKVARHGGLP
jgi:hypothetical protein